MPLSIGPLNLLDAFFDPSQYPSSFGTACNGLANLRSHRVVHLANSV